MITIPTERQEWRRYQEAMRRYEAGRNTPAAFVLRAKAEELRPRHLAVIARIDVDDDSGDVVFEFLPELGPRTILPLGELAMMYVWAVRSGMIAPECVARLARAMNWSAPAGKEAR